MHRANTKEKKDVFLNKLFEDNYIALLKFARLALPEEDMLMLDDIVQRIFCEAWKNMDMLLTHQNPRRWLMLTARNRIKAYGQNVQSKKTVPINSNENLSF